MDNGKHWLRQDANAQIARACLHYMSIDDLSAPWNLSEEETEFERRKKQYPFIRYAYEYWVGIFPCIAILEPIFQ